MFYPIMVSQCKVMYHMLGYVRSVSNSIHPLNHVTAHTEQEKVTLHTLHIPFAQWKIAFFFIATDIVNSPHVVTCP